MRLSNLVGSLLIVFFTSGICLFGADHADAPQYERVFGDSDVSRARNQYYMANAYSWAKLLLSLGFTAGGAIGLQKALALKPKENESLNRAKLRKGAAIAASTLSSLLGLWGIKRNWRKRSNEYEKLGNWRYRSALRKTNDPLKYWLPDNKGGYLTLQAKLDSLEAAREDNRANTHYLIDVFGDINDDSLSGHESALSTIYRELESKK